MQDHLRTNEILTSRANSYYITRSMTRNLRLLVKFSIAFVREPSTIFDAFSPSTFGHESVGFPFLDVFARVLLSRFPNVSVRPSLAALRPLLVFSLLLAPANQESRVKNYLHVMAIKNYQHTYSDCVHLFQILFTFFDNVMTS